jgi:hypothetical protein
MQRHSSRGNNARPRSAASHLPSHIESTTTSRIFGAQIRRVQGHDTPLVARTHIPRTYSSPLCSFGVSQTSER